MRWALPLLALIAAAPAPVAAQSVGDCGEIVSARNLPEPWEDHSAGYAEGQVRVAVIDTREPAAAARHLMVLSPPRDEIGDRQCRLVSLLPGEGPDQHPTGFTDIDFAAREASYDPQTGLEIVLPVEAFHSEAQRFDWAEMRVWISQSTGDVTAEIAGS